jgi:hypothetical protein
MIVRGWLIVGTNGTMPPAMYVGETIGALPNAANFLPGQWMLWRPVAAMIAETPTQMAVVCVEIPLP